MSEIQFKYIKKDQVETHTVTLPDSWEPMDERHLLDFTYCNHLPEEFSLKHESFLFRMLRIPMKLYKRINQAQKNDIIKALEFLTTDINCPKWIVRSKNTFPKGATPPDASFINITVDVFVNANNHFENYVETREETYLNNLCAALYASNLTGWKAVPIHIREAIYLNFRGILNYWAKAFPLIHQNSGGDNHFGWPGIIYDIAGGKLGTTDEVQQKPIKNILFIMEKIEFDRQKSENTTDQPVNQGYQ
ncbi:MAG: hypothetical protein ACEQSL_03600 [Sediminibacterium sp.]